MPELPEVETTRRGIAPHVTGRRVVRIDVYDSRLRWPVPSDLDARMRGRTIERVDRRSRCWMRLAPSRSIRRSTPPTCGERRARRAAIKLALMDSHVVSGVGNIYANEALFRAGIRPTARARRSIARAASGGDTASDRDARAGAIARQEPTAHGVMEGRVADARANGPDERLANGANDAATCPRRSAACGRRCGHRA
jgi:formamidopyrimidine-DNA glycosylase